MPLIDRETVTNSLKFWEIGRIFYNLILFLVTVLTVPWDAVFSQAFLLLMFVLAGMANAVYCAAYPLDLLVQASEWRSGWRRWRWAVWLLGTLFASALAHLLLAPLPFVTQG